jgi:hypothetical protein
MKGHNSRSLTGEQIDEVARRYRAGETVDELALAFKVSTAPIRNALRIRAVRMRVGAGRSSSRVGGWGIS